MASPLSSTPSLTPSRSPSPEPPVQPDHFYGNENANFSSPSSDGKTWLDPADDPLAQRGIPVFKPSMEEFQDFEGYMNKIECWGMRSGIVKVIPPKEWTDSLPPVTNQLGEIKLKNPIEQHMLGRGGLFRQENIEKRRIMSVREWAELCSKDDLRAPGVDDIGLHARATNGTAKTRTRRTTRRKTRDPETAEPEMTPEVQVKEEHEDEGGIRVEDLRQMEDKEKAPSPIDGHTSIVSHDDEQLDREHEEQSEEHPTSHAEGADHVSERHPSAEEGDDSKPKSKRRGQTKEAREAALAERAAKDEAFLETFDPHSDWLPPNTTQFDYTPEFCRELERKYWRNCGLGKPAWYGADMQGSLFTEQTTAWNVAHLPSMLSRLLPESSKDLPGVNTPYLYFGMWRATFAWHVEDMDLFSINYIHFGAPKYWYAMPQARAIALEHAMKSYFPKDISQCPQFLRHKSFLASPTLLSQSSCRPNTLVQHAGEFVITYPRGYHAGFNLGFNCAESVNFALESWLDLGRKAQICKCVNYSVRIDVDELLRQKEIEQAEAQKKAVREKSAKSKSSRKRKSTGSDNEPKAKKIKVKPSAKADPPAASAVPPPKVTLRLAPPKPKEPEIFPCCLCVSTSTEGLLRVVEPPTWRSPTDGSDSDVWMAHEECANVIPETWVDEIESEPSSSDGDKPKERVVYGVDAIVKDRWNLKCSACSKTKHKAHGAPIQCTKGKCPKAFHVSCARDGAEHGIVYSVVREVEKEVVLLEPQSEPAPPPPSHEASEPMTLDPALLSTDSAMAVDNPPPMQPPARPVDVHDSSVRVLKLIKKTEVQVLCPQHNPEKLEIKKAQKQERIRNDLLSLPPMTRIKLRVSAGVFEVSLVRVIEETKSVEVLWDRGLKREFKWGSVVFGSTETVVGQKPTEAAVEPQPAPAIAPAASYGVPSVPFAPLNSTTPTIKIRHSQYSQPVNQSSAAPQPSASSSSSPHTSGSHHQPQTSHYPHASYYQRPQTSYQPPGPPQHSPYSYSPPSWSYQYPPSGQSYGSNPQYSQRYPQPPSGYNPYTYYPGYSQQSSAVASSQPQVPRYYPPPPPSSYSQHSSQSPDPSQSAQSTSRRGLQWQRPYTGPKVSADGSTPSFRVNAIPYEPPRLNALQTTSQPQPYTLEPSDVSPSADAAAPAPPAPPSAPALTSDPSQEASPA